MQQKSYSLLHQKYSRVFLSFLKTNANSSLSLGKKEFLSPDFFSVNLNKQFFCRVSLCYLSWNCTLTLFQSKKRQSSKLTISFHLSKNESIFLLTKLNFRKKFPKPIIQKCCARSCDDHVFLMSIPFL